jgi:hypothetical protein
MRTKAVHVTAAGISSSSPAVQLLSVRDNKADRHDAELLARLGEQTERGSR